MFFFYVVLYSNIKFNFNERENKKGAIKHFVSVEGSAVGWFPYLRPTTRTSHRTVASSLKYVNM